MNWISWRRYFEANRNAARIVVNHDDYGLDDIGRAGRRALGIRLKLLVVLSAEVIGITFYGLIARALPEGLIRKALYSIAEEEKAHLEFHIEFFRRQNSDIRRRIAFWLCWLGVGSAAGVAVLIDHRRTFLHLGVDRRGAAMAFATLLIVTARAACTGAHRASSPTPLPRLEAKR